MPVCLAEPTPRTDGAAATAILVRCAGLAVAGAVGLWLVYRLAVLTPTGQLVDTRVMTLVADVLAGATWTGVLLALVSPASVLLAAATLAGIAGALRGAWAAAAVLVTTAATAVTAAALKALLERPQLVDGTANSLPSGHVAGVAGLAAAAALVVGAGARAPVLLLGSAAVALTGVATIALEWHRPSDVAASVLVAVTVAATVRAAAGVARLTGVPGARSTVPR